jgi:hypothetical protein
MERWRHKKSGTEYEIITDSAQLQCASAPTFEKRFHHFTVYRSVRTGAIFVRPTAEFNDGRFEPIPDTDAVDYERG